MIKDGEISQPDKLEGLKRQVVDLQWERQALIDLLDSFRPALMIRRIETMNHCKDSEGRPLIERHAPVEERSGIAMKMANCPYEGSRRGLPMNVSALNQIVRHRQELLAILSFIRLGYLHQHGLHQVGYCDMLTLCAAAVSLPGYLCFRSHNSIDHRRIPVAIALAYKAGAGMLIGARNIVRAHFTGHDHGNLSAIDTKHFIDFVESKDYLVSHNEACAATPKLIWEAVHTLISGHHSSSQQSNIESLILKPGEFYDVVSYVKDFSLLVTASELSDRQFLMHLDDNGLKQPVVKGSELIYNNAKETMSTITRSFEASIDAIHDKPVSVVVDNLLDISDKLPWEKRQKLVEAIPDFFIQDKLEDVMALDERHDGLLNEILMLIHQHQVVVAVDNSMLVWLLDKLLTYVKVRQSYLSLVQILEIGLNQELDVQTPARFLDWLDGRNCLSLGMLYWFESALGARIDITPTETCVRWGRVLYTF